MYIDGGRPIPGRFEETIENLSELSPSSFGNVSRAYCVGYPSMGSSYKTHTTLAMIVPLLIEGQVVSCDLARSGWGAT